MLDATRYTMNSPVMRGMERVGESVYSPDFNLTENQFRALRIPRIVDAVAPTTDQIIADRTRRLLAGMIFPDRDRFTPTMAAKLVQLAQ